MAAGGDAADDLAALLRSQAQFQRRADQLIPEQRDLLRPLPAFHRVLIEGVHHSADPCSSSEGSPDRCCRAMTLATIPGPTVPPSGATGVGPGIHRCGWPT